MQRHILSILVANQAGVLSKITGLFSRRGYNIHSLSVGVTEDPRYSRITIVLYGDDLVVDQIRKQVDKLIDVIRVVELAPGASVFREITLIKIACTAQNRSEIVGIVDIFRASIIDVSKDTVMVEMTGDQSKINAFLELAAPYGIHEIARAGLTALGRGMGSVIKAD